jgi:predicted esterase
MSLLRLSSVILTSMLLTAACGGDDGGGGGATAGSAGAGAAGAGGAAGSGTGGASGGGTGGAGGGGGTGGSPPGGHLCFSDPPSGAPQPAPMPSYSGGACPALVDGTNAVTSAGQQRAFILVKPQSIGASEKLPLAFLWHWMGGEAKDFLERGDIATAVEQQRFIAVIPESIGAGVFGAPGLDVKWPFDITQTPSRIDEELTFFDDMLACVTEQLPVNQNCISSAGVSAGALWTDQLAGYRGQYLAAILSLSGGVGGIIKPWGNPEHRMPALVLYGGPTDNCFGLLNFQTQSQQLEQDLEAGGHFLVECIHNCGHAQPPVDVEPGQSAFGPLWDFFLDHPYWLGTGESPYLETGLPDSYPDWCAIGRGNAVPRTGECIDPSQC